jgi:hypothetical protein
MHTGGCARMSGLPRWFQNTKGMSVQGAAHLAACEAVSDSNCSCSAEHRTIHNLGMGSVPIDASDRGPISHGVMLSGAFAALDVY